MASSPKLFVSVLVQLSPVIESSGDSGPNPCLEFEVIAIKPLRPTKSYVTSVTREGPSSYLKSAI